MKPICLKMDCVAAQVVHGGLLRTALWVELLTVGALWEEGGKRYRQILSLPTRASAMANAKCRSCYHAADAGAYCSSCAAAIMAKALNPVYGGRRKKSPRPDPSRPSAPSPQRRLFR